AMRHTGGALPRTWAAAVLPSVVLGAAGCTLQPSSTIDGGEAKNRPEGMRSRRCPCFPVSRGCGSQGAVPVRPVPRAGSGGGEPFARFHRRGGLGRRSGFGRGADRFIS